MKYLDNEFNKYQEPFILSTEFYHRRQKQSG